MNRTRVMPVLLLQGRGLVKTVKFANPKYLGDPINAVRIFNEKEVDELIFLDIKSTTQDCGPDFETLSDIAGEAFMPMAYGGGITTIEQIHKIFNLGFEKIIINSAAYRDLNLIIEAVAIFGSQSIVGCIDVRKNLLGRYDLWSRSGGVKEKVGLISHLENLVKSGVGEILVNSIDRDGTMSGYDLKILQQVTQLVPVPVIACGGAGSIKHFIQAVNDAQVSAVAAGSLFVFMGPHRAVMINYPERNILNESLP